MLPSLPISLPQVAVATVVVAAGAAVQGSVGMGLGLLAAPILLLLDPGFVPGPMLGAAVVLTVLVLNRDRQKVDFHGLKFALAGRVAGTPPAAYLVSALPAAYFNIVFATLIFVAVALSLLGRAFRPTPPRAVAAGTLSAFMATMCSVGGPPMALLYQHAEGSRLRGTLAGFFVVGASLSLIALLVVGRYGAAELVLTMTLVPGIVIGFVVSGPLARRVDGGGVRPMVLGLSFVSAVMVLWRALA